MNKYILSVLGKDRPGIIASVSGCLYSMDCNIENVSQTILQNEFSGVFILSAPMSTKPEAIAKCLRQGLPESGLHFFVTDVLPDPPTPIYDKAKSSPFVITTRGPDKKGLVAGITRVISDHGVNVTDLQAVFAGGDEPEKNVMIYEVDVPENTDVQTLIKDLREKAESLGLVISIQHRRVFEAINRI